MKQKTITTDKATLLVAELPEEAHSVRVCKHIRDGIHYLLYDGATNTAYKEFLPDGNWQLLGRLPDITEFQKEKIVGRYFNNYRVQQKLHQESINDMFWVRYPNGNDKFFDTKDECYSHAIDMEFNHLLKVNDIYFENPYKDPGLIPSYELDVYREAQSKVLDKERTYLLTKVD